MISGGSLMNRAKMNRELLFKSVRYDEYDDMKAAYDLVKEIATQGSASEEMIAACKEIYSRAFIRRL